MINAVRIHGRSWRTPLTDAPLRTVGSARLTKAHYRGVYRYEGVRGYEYYEAHGWLPVVGLQQRHGRRWQTWMVDDPLHWHGMDEAVDDLPDGRILVAGLGLGLMLHHMATDDRFTRITVVERNPDVAALIVPTLPPDRRVTVVIADFYRHLHEAKAVEYDGVLWDLAVGQPEQTMVDFMFSKVMVAELLGVPMVQFGMRRQPRGDVDENRRRA